jgi:hypothetical protein
LKGDFIDLTPPPSDLTKPGEDLRVDKKVPSPSADSPNSEKKDASSSLGAQLWIEMPLPWAVCQRIFQSLDIF